MKLQANYIKKVVNENNKIEITFEVDGWSYRRTLENLVKGSYTLDLREPSTNRSLNQNSLLWALIDEISKHEKIDDITLYCQLLEMANAKCEYMLVLPDALELLKSNFRAIQVVDEREYNGKKMLMVKVFYGSSKMNTKEMSILIDKALDYANEVGINTDYYSEVLSG